MRRAEFDAPSEGYWLASGTFVQRLAASSVVFWRLGPILYAAGAALFGMEQKTRA
jgi:hypothetical protein